MKLTQGKLFSIFKNVHILRVFTIVKRSLNDATQNIINFRHTGTKIGGNRHDSQFNGCKTFINPVSSLSKLVSLFVRSANLFVLCSLSTIHVYFNYDASSRPLIPTFYLTDFPKEKRLYSSSVYTGCPKKVETVFNFLAVENKHAV